MTRPPSAFAGFDLRAAVGEEVAFDGSLSLDPDGDPLDFAWHLAARPAGSAAALRPDDEVLARLIPDAPGTYVVALDVSDGALSDRDLVSVEVSEPRTSTPLSMAVKPGACNVPLSRPAAATCGDAGGRVVLSPDAIMGPGDDLSVEWTFARLPPGLSVDDLAVDRDPDPLGPLAFSTPRPGRYWVAARLVGAREDSPPAYAAVHVFDDDAPRAEPRVEGPRRASVGDRVILDGRGSAVPTATAARFTWSLFSDPSSGAAPLVDRATGCPPDRCQRLTPTAPGTYVVRLDIAVGTATGAPALHTVEVTE